LSLQGFILWIGPTAANPAISAQEYHAPNSQSLHLSYLRTRTTRGCLDYKTPLKIAALIKDR
jgi:hypothetical protein